MFKVTILNINDFLKTVNDCHGTVNLLHSDGRCEDLTSQFRAQSSLVRSFQEQGGYLRLALDVQNPKDYMKIVNQGISN